MKVKDEQSAGVVEVTDSTFQQEVLQSSVPVVVDFWAPWCGPCRTIAPITEKLANEYQGSIKFCKINVDENRQTAERFQVMSIPLLIFFKDGEAVDQSVGAVSEDALRSKLESMI
ncbi:MAG: thioredoxin [Chloroflexota bacterium]